MTHIKKISPEEQLSLLNKVVEGDEKAFRTLFNLYRKHVYSYALKITKSTFTAEDILHDVFLKIWLNKEVTKIEDVERYLKVATRNLALNVIRRRSLEIKANEEMRPRFEEAHNETEDTILYNEFNQILNIAISKLPPQQRAVYLLCKHDGLKYHEAAERLSLSPLTVKTHMQLALKFLRSHTGKNSDFVMFIILLQILEKK